MQTENEVRYFSYNTWKTDPSIDSYVETVDEEHIRKTFYPYWYFKMCEKYGKQHVDLTYCFHDCIDDWCTLHWAWEVND